jgi:2-amino-4-hydroxy-6-hydroxymethyldihydropteridine diphosphokinase
LGYLRSARRGVAALPGTRVLAASPVYETAPVGGPPQGPYLNAALLLETTAEPRALLAGLAALEDSAVRRRLVANGPRTLDLDLLVFGDEVSDDPRLTLPHPRFASRAFVLAPAADVAPELLVPGRRATVAELLARLGPAGREGIVRVAGPEEWS